MSILNHLSVDEVEFIQGSSLFRVRKWKCQMQLKGNQNKADQPMPVSELEYFF